MNGQGDLHQSRLELCALETGAIASASRVNTNMIATRSCDFKKGQKGAVYAAKVLPRFITAEQFKKAHVPEYIKRKGALCSC